MPITHRRPLAVKKVGCKVDDELSPLAGSLHNFFAESGNQMAYNLAAEIVTSGNSLAGYVKPENAMALSRAVHAYGRYPIRA